MSPRRKVLIMKILVTGAGGMLGSALVPALMKAGHDIVATDIDLSARHPWGPSGPELSHLDVREQGEVDAAFARHRPGFVAHLAAETDLEVCEAQSDHAVATNATATRVVATACAREDVALAYISTAGVFDGRKLEPYTEDDPPAPINAYGRTKLLGEDEVQARVPRSYVVRAGWMVGGGAKDHKFVAKILAQLRAGSRVLHVVNDKYGTPTYAPDFAECFTRLVTTGHYGLYHLACEGAGTRFDVCAHILDVLGMTDEVELVPVPSEYFAETYFAVRPRSEMMRNTRLERLGLNNMRPWRDALAEYITTYFESMTPVARA
jgi:dTDP-4-dehydrorhamnose reductase